MKINLIQTVITTWLSTVIVCLHLQQQPRIYDPDQYLNSMQQTQNQLKTDLLQIQQQFAQIDQSIKNAANDPLQQLRVYEEGIADERDSLFSIQQYLTLPYNERACKCFNFTDQLRKNLTDKIAKVGNSLVNVQNKAKQCSDCQIDIQIQKQIGYQKNYLKIIQDTVDAKCCTIYKIIYNDNLNAANYLYGNFTPSSYLTWIKQKTNNLTTSDILVRSCPIYAPYTSDNLQNCSSGCNNQNQLFNLYTRTCMICPVGKIFNYQKHTCDYDVVCPAGSLFNQETVMCEKIQPAYNNSLCPPQAPVWNQQALGCFKCDMKTPYYDINLQKCTTCPVNFTYNINTNECVYNGCTSQQYYNQKTKKCELKQGTTTVQQSNSNCPSDRPYWDKTSLSCSRCPTTQPFYNITSKSCQICPNGSNYDPSRNLCLMICGAGQRLNQLTFKCQNATEPTVQPGDGSLVSICPLDRPIWNSQTKSCSQCDASSPYWNVKTQKCQKCPIGQIWNDTLNSCQNQQTTGVTCPPGTQYHADTKTCVQSKGSIAFCPPQQPWYNSIVMACMQCPLNQPNYDAKTNQCTGGIPTPKPNPINPTPTPVCPTGHIYVPQKNSCQPTGQFGLIAICPPATPMWDVNTGTCIQCPSGQQWNSNIKMCIQCTDLSNCETIKPTPSINTTCQYNYQWNSTLSQCTKCLPYQKYNTATKKCDNFCKIDQIYNSNYDICAGTISKCPIGLLFNQQKLRCECSQGANYKYDPINLVCIEFCKINEYFDYLDQKCYPV